MVLFTTSKKNMMLNEKNIYGKWDIEFFVFGMMKSCRVSIMFSIKSKHRFGNNKKHTFPLLPNNEEIMPSSTTLKLW